MTEASIPLKTKEMNNGIDEQLKYCQFSPLPLTEVSDVEVYTGQPHDLPLLVQCQKNKLSISVWAAQNIDWIENNLVKFGAILLRGFHHTDQQEFLTFCENCLLSSLDYTYGSSPRVLISKGVYTTTDYPATEVIVQHNECSYQRTWPHKLAFFCDTPAMSGGETPLGRTRVITEHIPQEVKEKFHAKQILYVRNYRTGIDIPWQSVFQTEKRSEVEDFCNKNQIEFEWKENNELRTKQVCPAFCQHPKTKEMLWFNQAHLFHVSRLKESIRSALLRLFSEDNLPRNTYYGDGTSIEPEIMVMIRNIYEKEKICFHWQQGDVLLVDNILATHGRNPYTGKRKVLVAIS